jgi:hypothetical protein
MVKMNKNIFIIILILGILTMGFFWFTDNKEFKEKLKIEHKLQDSLKMSEAFLRYKNDSLLELEPKIYWKEYKAKKKLKTQEDETNAIPGIVNTYSNSKLDSILTNYRFTPRTKSSDSISN